MPVNRREFLRAAGLAPLAAASAPLAARTHTITIRDAAAPARPRFSGIYPHLAVYNDENECGIGAVVPWAGRLWLITYGPHRPFGSTDKLYEIDGELTLVVRRESVGGTHANRMIHRESRQLFIGLHAIDERRTVRTIPPSVMPGRQTGTARHLFQPATTVYYASMEEGFYEVDVETLAVRMLHRDGNTVTPADLHGFLPGYHGKGLYTAQGHLVYANNGEPGPEALTRPDIDSGALAEWNGREWNWRVVRRNQFTEVTGPGGISGSDHPDEPIWTYGWDHRSAIFMLRDRGTWHTFRMPKASHTYDGAHGWHTEWPRIRSIGGDRLLMTMHGMLWDFPKGFSAGHTGGIRPLSSYLKIIGDFCEWQGQVVFGCDDAAKAEFAANPIPAQGTLVERSNSNLWFVGPGALGQVGDRIGRGGPWVRDTVAAGIPSDPFSFAGFDHRVVHVTHRSARPVTFSFEADARGTGEWRPAAALVVEPRGYGYHLFDPGLEAEWIRVTTDAPADEVTLVYQLASRTARPSTPSPLFQGLARWGEPFTTGVILSAGDARGSLHFGARHVSGSGEVTDLGLYDMGPDMVLQPSRDQERYQALVADHSPREAPYTVDAASVVVTDVEGRRYRLPRGVGRASRPVAGVVPRTLREIVTERSVVQCEGHLYEVPRQNSGGFSRIRPIATSEHPIMDMCSWRGLLVIAGVTGRPPDHAHIIRSTDGRCALWVGVADDLWTLGKPRGRGGPWHDTAVETGDISDPYLMTGYDHKQATLSHRGDRTVELAIDVDLTGTGDWATYRTFTVPAGRVETHHFPEGFNAYWARVRAAGPTVATVLFEYS
jgi:hypothetical protein